MIQFKIFARIWQNSCQINIYRGLALEVVSYLFPISAHVVEYDRHLLVLTGGLNVGVTRKISLSRHAEHSAHRKTSEPSSPGKLPKFARKWQKNTPRPPGSQRAGSNLRWQVQGRCFTLSLVFNQPWICARESMRFKLQDHPLPTRSKSIGFRLSPRISSSKL